MPIDFYSSLKKTSRWAFGSKLLNNIFGSSLYTSILITLVVMLVIMFVYPSKSGTKAGVLFKLFIYIFMGSLVILFIHDGVLNYMMSEKQEERNQSDVMRLATKEGRENFFEENNMAVKPEVFGGSGAFGGSDEQNNQPAGDNKSYNGNNGNNSNNTEDDFFKKDRQDNSQGNNQINTSGDSILGGSVLGGSRANINRRNNIFAR